MSFSGKYKGSVDANLADSGLMSFNGIYKFSVVANYAERGAEVVTDEVLNEYRLKRVHLKDQLYELLKKN